MHVSVGVRQASHSRHHAEHVIVGCINAHGGAEVESNAVVGDGEQQGRIVDTRQVASTGRLVLLRLESERVHVDADRRYVGVVLVRLYPVEIRALAHRETVVAVQLDQSGNDRVLACHALHAGDGVARLQHRAIPPVAVVERLLAFVRANDRGVATDIAVALDNPDELLARVVEVQLQLVTGAGDGLATSELENIDQVLVGDLGEFTALIRIQVDVVNIQGRSDQTSLGYAIVD